jgi:hypothetical protein
MTKLPRNTAVALMLNQQFAVRPENLAAQGYGTNSEVES